MTDKTDWKARNRELLKEFAWDGNPAVFFCTDCGIEVTTCNPAGLIQCKACKERDTEELAQKNTHALNRRRWHEHHDDYMART